MKKLVALLGFILCGFLAGATHNRAGEITYVRLSDFTYRFTVVTYTKESVHADRCELEIQWGDGSLDTISRINGLPVGSCPHTGETVGNDVKKNIYVGVHTFPGPGSYSISVTDLNRNEGVINIPNSVGIPFHVRTTLLISPFLGINSSPVLLNPPIDDACACKKFIHNPNAYDPDGDSLSYSLVNSKGENGKDIPGYYIPNGVTINSLTGDLVWNCPSPSGEFNFAILIREWRNKVVIGSIIRDMQVTVSGSCTNNPPVIAPLQDLCVDAGTKIDFTVTSTDPDMDQTQLSSTGGPYLLPTNPATFVAGAPASTVSGQFTWETHCSHIRLQPYSVTFKAVNTLTKPNLADLKTINITVVGPAPLGLTATPVGNSIQLNWQASKCSQAVGYRIFRRNGPSGWTPATCETGIPAYTGYTQIGTSSGLNNTSFTDNNNGSGLIHGIDYCYMIYAYYPDGAKSYASIEVCSELKKDVPIITNVSVFKTSTTNGADSVVWSKPTDIDLSEGPFKYEVYRSGDLTGSSYTFVGSLEGVNDTIFVDNAPGLNTESNPNSYRIDFFKLGNVYAGSTHIASSVFLSTTPADNQLTLNWNENVPWSNKEYHIYRQEPGASNFTFIGTSTTRSFVDNGLVNGKEYCYYVRSEGEYSASGIIRPIFNTSQIACGIPKDLTPPCSPVLSVSGNCDQIQNTLVWNNPNHSCADDVVMYKVYYKPVIDSLVNFFLIATVTNLNDTTLTHNFNNSIAGCYTVTAIDSFGNESAKSLMHCIDNCPIYTLPNVFTPDGDGLNDFFRPLMPYRFIDAVEFKVFNRWGQLMFETTDPDLNWDGRNKSGKLVSEGVYFYTCIVKEIRLIGIVPRQINGFVHIFTGSSAGQDK